ncbi:TPA: transcriptional regulator [Candidatus Uhrbacteria bacterium]|nr:transcriptional regulator [Candidatus Uhrbacteria bacterium]
MEPYESILMELGLGLKEARVYLALLKEGPSSVRQMAAATGLNRGTVFDLLKALQVSGLARYYNEKTRQYFVASPPDKLKELAEERTRAVARANTALDHLVPELESLYDNGDKHPAARMYEGQEGIRAILEDILETMAAENDKEYYVYSSSAVRDAGLYASFPDYTAERIGAGVTVKTIALGTHGSTAGLDERKWIKAIEGTPTYILIYGGKVAYIFLGKTGELMGLIMENRGLFVTQRLLFMELWNRLG